MSAPSEPGPPWTKKVDRKQTNHGGRIGDPRQLNSGNGCRGRAALRPITSPPCSPSPVRGAVRPWSAVGRALYRQIPNWHGAHFAMACPWSPYTLSVFADLRLRKALALFRFTRPSQKKRTPWMSSAKNRSSDRRQAVAWGRTTAITLAKGQALDVVIQLSNSKTAAAAAVSMKFERMGPRKGNARCSWIRGDWLVQRHSRQPCELEGGPDGPPASCLDLVKHAGIGARFAPGLKTTSRRCSKQARQHPFQRRVLSHPGNCCPLIRRMAGLAFVNYLERPGPRSALLGLLPVYGLRQKPAGTEVLTRFWPGELGGGKITVPTLGVQRAESRYGLRRRQPREIPGSGNAFMLPNSLRGRKGRPGNGGCDSAQALCCRQSSFWVRVRLPGSLPESGG